MGQDDPRKFLILGCHRTGTTMMRLILDSHPDIHCFDEWKGYTALEEGDYTNPKNAKLLGFKCPNWTYWLVESDEHQKICEAMPVIFMLRDVRGCITSMLRLKTGSGSFFKGIQTWPDRTQLKDHHKEELARIKTLSCPEYRVAAFYWRYMTEQYIELAKMGWPVLPIHYEQFVQFPESHLRVICNFLQVPWDDALLRHYEFEHDETPGGRAVGNTALDRPVDALSVMIWKDVLTVEQEEAILETAGGLNDYVSVIRQENEKRVGVSQY